MGHWNPRRLTGFPKKMKNVIYCFYEKPVDWHDDYGQVTLPRMKEYAASIDADFKTITSDFFPPIVKKVDKIFKEKEYPHHQWLHFWNCTVSSMFLHYELLDSQYERMLVLAADVYVAKHAENIFEDEELKTGVSMICLNDSRYGKHMKHDINLFFNTQVDNCYYSPIVMSDRAGSLLVVDNFISDEEFLRAAESLNYVEEPRGEVSEVYTMENPNAPEIATFMEEHLYSYLFHKGNIKVNSIDRSKWMRGILDLSNPTGVNQVSNMYHFAGPNKKYLFDSKVLDTIDNGDINLKR